MSNLPSCPLCGSPCKEDYDGDSNNLVVCTKSGLATSPCNYRVYADCHEAICAKGEVMSDTQMRTALTKVMSLVQSAQEVLTEHLTPGGPDQRETLLRLFRIFDGPEQRSIEVEAKKALESIVTDSSCRHLDKRLPCVHLGQAESVKGLCLLDSKPCGTL